jgi:hypothetical protein
VLIDCVAESYFFDIIPFIFEVKNISIDIFFSNSLTIFIFLIFILSIFFLFRYLPAPRFLHSYPIAGLLLILDISQGSSAMSRIGNYTKVFGNFDIATSIGNRLTLQLYQEFRSSEKSKTSDYSDIPSAMNFTQDAEIIVLIIIESLGIPEKHENDPNFNYGHILNRYPELKLIKNGIVPSVGSTVSGEMRELCGKAVPGVKILDDYSQCWPIKLSAQGYQTIAVHSYRSSFFERRTWWKDAGFKKRVFMDTSVNMYPMFTNGALNGFSDREMLEGELRSIDTRNKTFFYYLTSNSHLPVPYGTTVQNSLEQALDNVLSGVTARQKTNFTARKEKPHIRLVIVGDHPPPVIGSERGTYVDKAVPFWIFEPKLEAVNKTE